MGNCEGGKIIMSNGNVQRVREQFDKLYSGLNCRMFVFVFHYNLYILFLLQFIFFKFILFYTGSFPPLTTTTGSSSTTGSMTLIFIKNNLLKYLLIL